MIEFLLAANIAISKPRVEEVSHQGETFLVVAFDRLKYNSKKRQATMVIEGLRKAQKNDRRIKKFAGDYVTLKKVGVDRSSAQCPYAHINSDDLSQKIHWMAGNVSFKIKHISESFSKTVLEKECVNVKISVIHDFSKKMKEARQKNRTMDNEL